MDEESQPPVSRWSTPFWVQFRATVAGGLVLAGLLGLIAFVASQIGDLSGGQILGFIVAPGAVVILLLMGVLTGRTLLRIARQWTVWQGNVSLHVVELVAATRRLYLRDVISTAEREGWTVYDDEDHDLMFVSPDGARYFVQGASPDAVAVAAELAELAPGYFPVDWEAFAQMDQTELSSQTSELAERTNQIEQAIRNVEDGLPLQIARALVRRTMEDAADSGWEVHDMHTVIQFIHGDRGEMATLDLAEPLDLGRLRAALQLDKSAA